MYNVFSLRAGQPAPSLSASGRTQASFSYALFPRFPINFTHHG